jgi:hypothetical protein
MSSISNQIKVLHVTNGLFLAKVLVEAVSDCEEVLDSFLGKRLFFPREGKRRWIKVSKRSTLRENDIVSFQTYVPQDCFITP